MTQKSLSIISIIFLSLFLIACAKSEAINQSPQLDKTIESSVAEESMSSTPPKGSRDNTSTCLTPLIENTIVLGNDTVTIDITNASCGYICVTYIGDAARTRLIVTTPSDKAYTYDLTKDICDVFPLTDGGGTYNIGIYELISGNDYSVLYNEDFSVDNIDEFLPYLYPNQYVNFTSDSQAVKLAADLVYSANGDAEAISMVYNYVIKNISYDYEKAENVESTYVPDIDNILSLGKGICFDYASLMAAMLRSQGIPTRLEIGYAGDVYHAWISTYIKDVGWVNGMIQFDGTDWEIMDPTFAANMSEDRLRTFIGNGDNYITKYIY